MGNTAHVKGLSELDKFLSELPAKLEKNVMRGALRAGASVIKEEAKQQLASNGSIKTGELQRGLKVSTNAKGGKVTASVKAKGKHQYIAHMLEFTGAKPHVIESKEKKGLEFNGVVYRRIEHPGFKARPFMRPALDGKAGASLVAVGETIKKRLTKEGINMPDIDIEEV